MSIVLKQKHSLLGKNLLPLALRLKDVEIQDERELARLKKEYPLTRYSLEELETEFKSLTGEEAKEVLSLVDKPRDINNVRLLVHVAVCMANDVGAPKSTPIARSSILVEPGSRPSTSQSQSGESREGEAVKELIDGEKKKADLETRLEKMESAMKEVKGNTDKEILMIRHSQRHNWQISEMDRRFRYLSSLVDDTKYGKQKSSLVKEFEKFLSEFSDNKMLDSSPEDICRFLINKDKGGKTKVHDINCGFVGERFGDCECPCRLSAGSVQSTLGKLSKLFEAYGRGKQWDPISGSGNPVSSLQVKKYVRAIQKEQAQSHVRVTKAKPLFIEKLRKIVIHINEQLKLASTNTDKFVFLRDKAFLLLQFFAGDRANDLGQVLIQEIKSLPGNAGLLFCHTVGKTLNNGRENVFAIQRVMDVLVCPVHAVEVYVSAAECMGLNMSSGYLFRPLGKNKMSVLDGFLSYSVIYERLKFYLGKLNIDEGETPHSLRRGCAVTLSLSGSADVEKNIIGHIGWFSSRSLDRYSEMKNLVDVGSVSNLFAQVPSIQGIENVYKSCGDYDRLPKAFR